MLQEISREKLETIAYDTGLSIATVQRRIKFFRSSGVIERETVLISLMAIDYTMTFLIFVEMERERLDQLEAFHRKAIAESHVQQCYYITGEADFALVALDKDIVDFEQLTQRLFYGDENIKRFRASVVMNRVKASMAVPLDNGQ